jgi:hypothetical protein
VYQAAVLHQDRAWAVLGLFSSQAVSGPAPYRHCLIGVEMLDLTARLVLFNRHEVFAVVDLDAMLNPVGHAIAGAKAERGYLEHGQINRLVHSGLFQGEDAIPSQRVRRSLAF